jgi:hypothetical protein
MSHSKVWSMETRYNNLFPIPNRLPFVFFVSSTIRPPLALSSKIHLADNHRPPSPASSSPPPAATSLNPTRSGRHPSPSPPKRATRNSLSSLLLVTSNWARRSILAWIGFSFGCWEPRLSLDGLFCELGLSRSVPLFILCCEQIRLVPFPRRALKFVRLPLI